MVTHHGLHEGVIHHDGPGALKLRIFLRSIAACGRVGDRTDLHAQALGVASGGQRTAQALAGGRLVERFTLHAQQPVVAVARQQLLLQRQFAHW